MAACQNGDLDMVDFLLTLPQVEVNAKDKVTVMYMCTNGKVKVVVTNSVMFGLSSIMFVHCSYVYMLFNPEWSECSDVCK